MLIREKKLKHTKYYITLLVCITFGGREYSVCTSEVTRLSTDCSVCIPDVTRLGSCCTLVLTIFAGPYQQTAHVKICKYITTGSQVHSVNIGA
jgi:hypothetical protein